MGTGLRAGRSTRATQPTTANILSRRESRVGGHGDVWRPHSDHAQALLQSFRQLVHAVDQVGAVDLTATVFERDDVQRRRCRALRQDSPASDALSGQLNKCFGLGRNVLRVGLTKQPGVVHDTGPRPHRVCINDRDQAAIADQEIAGTEVAMDQVPVGKSTVVEGSQHTPKVVDQALPLTAHGLQKAQGAVVAAQHPLDVCRPGLGRGLTQAGLELDRRQNRR